MADWQPGDLALCVDTRDRITVRGDGRRIRGTAGRRLRKGALYTVTRVALRYQGLCLALAEDASGRMAGAFRFRKVTPGADIEGIEERRRLPVKEDA